MKKTLIAVFSLLTTMLAANVASANQFIPEENRIKPDLETVMINPGNAENGPQYIIIDHNPTLYNKQVVGSHTVEGWTKNGVAYSAVDGVITKSYRINANLETVMTNPGGSENGPQHTVIDHNPTLYNKQVVAGHTVEGWTKNGAIYTSVDGIIVKD